MRMAGVQAPAIELAQELVGRPPSVDAQRAGLNGSVYAEHTFNQPGTFAVWSPWAASDLNSRDRRIQEGLE